jgi:hypothetical protein
MGMEGEWRKLPRSGSRPRSLRWICWESGFEARVGGDAEGYAA